MLEIRSHRGRNARSLALVVTKEKSHSGAQLEKKFIAHCFLAREWRTWEGPERRRRSIIFWAVCARKVAAALGLFPPNPRRVIKGSSGARNGKITTNSKNKATYQQRCEFTCSRVDVQRRVVQ